MHPLLFFPCVAGVDSRAAKWYNKLNIIREE